MNDDRLAMLPQAINQGEADNAYILWLRGFRRGCAGWPFRPTPKRPQLAGV